jgi:uncharacterized protein (TIGR00304 family)
VLDLTTVGVLLVLGGFAVVTFALLSSTNGGKGEVKGGGVVLIGPIPIVFGSDARWASVAVALALVLVVLLILFYGA